MSTKHKRKSQKRSKDKDRHPRRCKCEECSEKRENRTWNKRKIKIAKEDAVEDKRRKEAYSLNGDNPGFLAGGHPNLKRDFFFEENDGDYPDALTTPHANARRIIKREFPNNKLKDSENKFIYPFPPMGQYRLWRAYQMDIDNEKFNAVHGKIDENFLWHGTGFKNLNNIAHNNLEVRGGWGLLGAGIYLAPTFNKAWGFSGWHSSYKTVLICATKLGKVLDSRDCVTHIPGCDKTTVRNLWGRAKCNPKCKWHKPNASNVRGMSFDSAAANRGYHPGAYGGNLIHTEYCTYNADRVLPLYVLVFAPEGR